MRSSQPAIIVAWIAVADSPFWVHLLVNATNFLIVVYEFRAHLLAYFTAHKFLQALNIHTWFDCCIYMQNAAPGASYLRTLCFSAPASSNLFQSELARRADGISLMHSSSFTLDIMLISLDVTWTKPLKQHGNKYRSTIRSDQTMFELAQAMELVCCEILTLNNISYQGLLFGFYHKVKNGTGTTCV